MSGQPTYSRRAQKGASSEKSSSSRHTSTRDPLPQLCQTTGMLKPPSQNHLFNHRFIPHGSAPAHGQSAVDSKWQHPAPNTASPQGSASGSYSARNSSTDNAQYGSYNKKGGTGGAGIDDKRESSSIWERTASRIGGHDRGAGLAFRPRTPLPKYLREP
ncbi:hypothetical protein F4782DRAFT_135679 [Xylaria castorea]|nr:hypothetical protein F4782DRAFT_135679 [Xylaria castorea]